MLGVLCRRLRPPFSPPPFSYTHGGGGWTATHFDRRLHSTIPFPAVSKCRAAASVWHTILPCRRRRRRNAAVLGRHENEAVVKRGEGSWNAAWDSRPARWLHHTDSAWFLFGVCATLASAAAAAPAIDSPCDSNPEVLSLKTDSSSNYRVRGVTADGRCLFRAIAHMVCLRNGENAPDENHQRELADELRAQVVEEMLKRRKELAGFFLEEEFDGYVENIRQPYVWGGEHELLMASHVLRTPISVFEEKRGSNSLINKANYGEEYKRDGENAISVLFHDYGHYEILEAV
ncbi:hypothetical protein ABFS82_06G159100 [Erythranthe guttata]|uniref:Ubiquitin thioesterase OTU n=1 Tax=Erythranthe guttata TaxID=4155 RepID=A0A022RDF0_ERYGU|nr:PREDICTED: uncharacterized protein LOC105957317 [Erythranthe guttata]EYU38064.1 hypothetical protein MIMGU_mgv1a011222mg [Erythranthe guttata]|eukprot:XP_012836701.1 PREDICTED: uncharacterized protein LOC105957317 [Erythranthe guttata]